MYIVVAMLIYVLLLSFGFAVPGSEDVMEDSQVVKPLGKVHQLAVHTDLLGSVGQAEQVSNVVLGKCSRGFAITGSTFFSAVAKPVIRRSLCGQVDVFPRLHVPVESEVFELLKWEQYPRKDRAQPGFFFLSQ
jgi:hypothetical protein